MNESQITKMEVLTPERVYKGNEDDRDSMPRNEGVEIVLHFTPETFEHVQEKISKLPVLGLNTDNYLTGDNGNSWDYKDSTPEQIQAETNSILNFLSEGAQKKLASTQTMTAIASTATETREEARERWNNWQNKVATLHQDNGFVINAEIGEEPNTIVIIKQQKDTDSFVSRNESYGSRGTRKINDDDVQKISYALEHELNVNVPLNFEKELAEAMDKAQPKHGYAPRTEVQQMMQSSNMHKDYRDIPGASHSISF